VYLGRKRLDLICQIRFSHTTLLANGEAETLTGLTNWHIRSGRGRVPSVAKPLQLNVTCDVLTTCWRADAHQPHLVLTEPSVSQEPAEASQG